MSTPTVPAPRTTSSGALPRLAAQLASRRALAQVRRVAAVHRPDEPAVAALYAAMQTEVPLLAPVVLHAASVPALTAAWALTRETWLASPVQPAIRETVIEAVSHTNTCPYCEQTHRMLRLADPDVDPARAAAARTWALATRTPGSPTLDHPPFTKADAPGMLSLAVGYHYTNRMVNVFVEQDQLALPRGLRALQPLAERLAVRTVARRLVQQHLPPGAALALLPQAPLPEDLAWAAQDDRLAMTMAGAAALLEPGAQLLGPAAALLVRRHLTHWQGQDPGLSRAWVEAATADLTPQDRPAARLALLVALASHQVDDDVVNQARTALHGDTGVIEVAAWAAFSAARRIGCWLTVPT